MDVGFLTSTILPNILTKIHDHQLHTIGFILVMLFCFSLIVNLMILIVFIISKDVRKPSNFFSVVLSFYNIIQTICYLPLIIAGTYNRE